MASEKARVWKRGSLTVEASLIVPIFIFIMAAAMNTGMDLYSESKHSQVKESYTGLWAVDDFYRLQAVTEVIKQKGESKDEGVGR